jgi:ABC-type Mn2+/Zn2+ transport system permease subunit
MSYHLNLPCGPAIVMTCIVLFIMSLLPRTVFHPRHA